MNTTPAGPAIKAIVFDAYGTIFDVHSIAKLAETMFAGRGAELAALWRTKQIDYTRIRSMSGHYEPFSKVTRDALVHSGRALGLALDDERLAALMRQYDHLDVFDDASRALAALRNLGAPLAILSNGDAPMLEAIVANNRLEGVFASLLSVDRVGVFKTAPEAYALGPRAFDCTAPEILFVSSNCWDACGAAWYGYTAFWINRAGLPLEELDVVPAGQGRTMDDVLAFAERRLATPFVHPHHGVRA